jgi:hypothetical protein
LTVKKLTVKKCHEMLAFLIKASMKVLGDEEQQI